MFDFGDPVPLSVEIRDAVGVLANATSVSVSIVQPDGTSATISNPIAPASTGVYAYTFTPTQSGRHTVRWVASGTNASAYTDSFDVDQSAPTGIVSLADVRARLNLSATTSDEELRFYIDAATDYVEGIVGPVVRQTITRTIPPASNGTIFLDGPAISLTSMTDPTGYGWTYNTTSYLLDPSGIITPLYGLTYPPTGYPVTVTYVAGYTVVPALIREAALDYVQWSWESQRGPTFSAPEDQFGPSTSATPPYKIEQKLQRYVVPSLA